MSRIYALILSVGAFVIALDQYTKQLVLDRFSTPGESRELFSWFSFTLVHNRAAAFGMFNGLPDSLRGTFFLLMPLAVITLLWWSYVRRFEAQEILGPVSMGLVLGGAVGNLIDRLRHGYVIDFIDWYYHSSARCLPQFHHFTPDTCHWPVFNVADSAISVALVLLIIYSFRQDKKLKEAVSH